MDFIINSVEDVLEKEFGQSLSDKDVHVIDPFTGTGTFMTRLEAASPLGAARVHNLEGFKRASRRVARRER